MYVPEYGNFDLWDAGLKSSILFFNTVCLVSLSGCQQVKKNMKNEDKVNTTQIRVRYADIDKMGVAHNSIYLIWFEIGRTELLRDVGFTYRDIEKNGIRLPVIEAGIKYLKPAYYDDVLSIKTILGRKRRLRMRFEYQVWRNNERLATGFTEHVFTNENLYPTRPPKELNEYLREFWNKNMDSPDRE